jgi:hypothetical protein
MNTNPFKQVVVEWERAVHAQAAVAKGCEACSIGVSVVECVRCSGSGLNEWPVLLDGGCRKKCPRSNPELPQLEGGGRVCTP